MRVRPGLAATAVVAIVAVGALVLGPQAQSAQALVSPPDPVTFPGSAVSTSNGISAGEWNKLLTNNPDKVWNATTTGSAASKVSVSGSGAGSAASGVAGFFMGTSIGAGINTMIGADTSGDFFCDLGTLIGTAGDCWPQAADTYVANSDVVVTAPGWAVPSGGVNYSPLGDVWWGGTAGSSRMRLTITETHGSGVVVSGQMLAGANTPTGVSYTTTSGATYGAVGSWNAVFGSAGYLSAGQVFSQTLPDNVVGVRVSTSGSAQWWWAEGQPNRPPDVSANPERTWRTTWECTSGPGGVASSAAFHEADAAWPSVPQGTCSAGQMSTLLVEEVTLGNPTLVYQWSLPAEVSQAAATYPDCVGQTCELLLERVTAPGASTYLNCFDSAAACVDWWTETSQATQSQEESQYRCRYGNYAVALSECKVYSQAFKTGVYADPTTGETDPETDPGSDPEADTGCPPPFSWLSLFNPWWYYQGTVCAVKATVVPSSGFWTSTSTSLKTSLGTHAPFSVIGAIPGVVSGLSTGWSGACANMPNFSTIEGKPLTFPCSPPDSAGWRTAYGLMTVLVWVAVAFAVWGMAHKAVGGSD